MADAPRLLTPQEIEAIGRGLAKAKFDRSSNRILQDFAAMYHTLRAALADLRDERIMVAGLTRRCVSLGGERDAALADCEAKSFVAHTLELLLDERTAERDAARAALEEYQRAELKMLPSCYRRKRNVYVRPEVTR